MPVWNLRYPDTVDDRIRAREDAARFRADLHVHAVFIRRDPEIPDPVTRYYWVDVHLNEDETETQDPALDQLARDNIADQTPHSPLPFFNVPFPIERYQNRAEDRERILQEFLRHPIQRALIDQANLARSVVEPLRRNLDYHGIARRIFLVEELPLQALTADNVPNPLFETPMFDYSMGTSFSGSIHPADPNARVAHTLRPFDGGSQPQEPRPTYKTRFERLMEDSDAEDSD